MIGRHWPRQMEMHSHIGVVQHGQADLAWGHGLALQHTQRHKRVERRDLVRLQTEAPQFLCHDDRVNPQPQRNRLAVARSERNVLRERGDFADAQQDFVARLGSELVGERLVQHDGVRRNRREGRGFRRQLPEVLVHAEDVNAVRTACAVSGVRRAGQREDGRGLEIRRQFSAEEAVAGGHRGLDFAEPCQRHVAQAAAHGVAHQQRADEDGAAQRRAQQHAQMRARVKAQAAEDERAEGHGVMECGDLSPLSAGDLSPSRSVARACAEAASARASRVTSISPPPFDNLTATSRLAKAARTRRTPKRALSVALARA